MPNVGPTSTSQNPQYVIDAVSHDWRLANEKEVSDNSVRKSDSRKYRDSNPVDTFSNGNSKWVADHDGNTTFENRRYSINNDGDTFATANGSLDYNKRYAFTKDGATRLEGYTEDGDGEDGYDPRDLKYSYTNNLTGFMGVDGTRTAWNMHGQNWNEIAKWAVQRYLDLMNDTSGAVTSDMKAELSLQAGEMYNSGGKAPNEDGSPTFFNLVDQYQKRGIAQFAAVQVPDDVAGEIQMLRAYGVSEDVINSKIIGAGGDPLSVSRVPADRDAYRHAVREFVTKLTAVTSKMQPLTPGAREARKVFSGMWTDEEPDPYGMTATGRDLERMLERLRGRQRV